MKMMGALLIIVGCSTVGSGMCRSLRREQRALEQLLLALDWMVCELNYRMPPLSQLCRGASEQCKGSVSLVFQKLAAELDGQVVPNPAVCMTAAMAAVPQLPSGAAQQLTLLGQTLGRFDLRGQLAGFDSAIERCSLSLEHLRADSQTKLRQFQTLGICAGVALVILFL